MRNTHDLTPGGSARDELMTRSFEPLNTPMISAPCKTLFPKTQPGPDPPQPSDSGEGPVIVRSSDQKLRAAKQKLRPTVDEFHPCQRHQHPQESYQQHGFQPNPYVYYTQQVFQQTSQVYFTFGGQLVYMSYNQPAPQYVSQPNGHLWASRCQSPLQPQGQVRTPPVQAAPISRPSSAPARGKKWRGKTWRGRDGPPLSDAENQRRLINNLCFYCASPLHRVHDCPDEHEKQRKLAEAGKKTYLGYVLPVENPAAGQKQKQQQQQQQGVEQELHEEEATEDSTGGTTVLERLIDATPQPPLITPRRRTNSSPPTPSCNCDFKLKQLAECSTANTRRRSSMH